MINWILRRPSKHLQEACSKCFHMSSFFTDTVHCIVTGLVIFYYCSCPTLVLQPITVQEPGHVAPAPVMSPAVSNYKVQATWSWSHYIVTSGAGLSEPLLMAGACQVTWDSTLWLAGAGHVTIMVTIIIYYGHYNKLFSVTDRKNLTITVFFKPPINGLGDVKCGILDKDSHIYLEKLQHVFKI